MYWNDDDQLIRLIKDEMYTSVIGDIMDQMGYFHQFLPPDIQPLDKTMFIAGRAMTVTEMDIDNEIFQTEMSHLVDKPFGLMLEALDDLRQNEVYICSGSSAQYALWGELMSARAIKLGAAGAVVNGYSRDTRGILQMNFPTFSYGSYGQDQAPRGKVIAFREPLKLGNVTIHSADMVIGDLDGVCVVPQRIEKEVFTRAIEKARGEKTVYTKILEGMSAKKAFETYKIM